MANPEATVSVLIEVGGKATPAEIPATMPISRLLRALVARLELPDAPYAVQLRSSGETLLCTDTPSEAGVKDGDVLRIIMVSG